MQIISTVINVIFGVALFVNGLLFIPQITRLFKTKHANNISLVTFAGFNVMNLFAVLHGIVVNDKILVIGYGLSVITNTIVTILIVKYKYFGDIAKTID
ncbi:MAG TPA: PQ-loop domain-containing transporter [Aquella sp.]|nr:PQ-loop domain-containing transporter [Aquella sp.]